MKIPSSFLKTDVVVALSIPMPAQKDGTGITFPLVEGKIIEVEKDYIVLTTARGDNMLIPDTRIQHLIQASKIAKPDNGLVDANGERV